MFRLYKKQCNLSFAALVITGCYAYENPTGFTGLGLTWTCFLVNDIDGQCKSRVDFTCRFLRIYGATDKKLDTFLSGYDLVRFKNTIVLF